MTRTVARRWSLILVAICFYFVTGCVSASPNGYDSEISVKKTDISSIFSIAQYECSMSLEIFRPGSINNGVMRKVDNCERNSHLKYQMLAALLLHAKGMGYLDTNKILSWGAANDQELVEEVVRQIASCNSVDPIEVRSNLDEDDFVGAMMNVSFIQEFSRTLLYDGGISLSVAGIEHLMTATISDLKRNEILSKDFECQDYGESIPFSAQIWFELSSDVEHSVQ